MKLIVLLIVLLLLSSGCGIYNLEYFVIPDDAEFIAVVESLDTPKKICAYMEENFTHKLTIFAYTPYQMWLLNTQDKFGDCNDYATWAVFVAHYHGYEVYLILVDASYKYSHVLGVFMEDGYSYSDNWSYNNIEANTFKEIVDHHIKKWGAELYGYKVYDYENNVIEIGDFN